MTHRDIGDVVGEEGPDSQAQEVEGGSVDRRLCIAREEGIDDGPGRIEARVSGFGVSGDMYLGWGGVLTRRLGRITA